jgi:hypothetical protein
MAPLQAQLTSFLYFLKAINLIAFIWNKSLSCMLAVVDDKKTGLNICSNYNIIVETVLLLLLRTLFLIVDLLLLPNHRREESGKGNMISKITRGRFRFHCNRLPRKKASSTIFS